MRVTVIGSNGTIGHPLAVALENAGHEVIRSNRGNLDLLALPDRCPEALYSEAVYICASRTRFIECEDDPTAYRVNVDAPIHIARWFPKVVYLSSEAVERALHTNYGMHKALAEIGLRNVCDPVIARICPKNVGITRANVYLMNQVCEFLVSLANARPGVYRWEPKRVAEVKAA